MALLAFIVVATTFAAGPRYFEPAAWTVRDGASESDAERSRIQQHLAAVEATLREETPPQLTDRQRAARLRAMDALHVYWTRGEFPRNLDGPRRTPVFIDDLGTPCAMGYLIIASGDDALAREIATYENNDFVVDIDHPRLSTWLDANGLTAEEAGWVQPSYDACGVGFVVGGAVCGADGRSYQCGAAADCAGVEVVSEGECGSGTSTSTGTTGSSGDVVRADDVCEDESTGMSGDEGPDTSGMDSTSTTTGSSSSSTGATSTGTDASTSASSGTSDEGSTSGASAEGKSRGCRVGGAPPTWMALLLLFGVRRRSATGS